MALKISEQAFSVAEEARLKLSNVRGHVVIHASEAANQILVKATLDPESGDAERTQVEMRQEENGEVVVKTHYTEPFWGFFNRLQPCRVDYDVTVPANCKVNASSVSGSMAVTGVHGVLELSTISGELEITDTGGELSVSTVSGGLTGHGLAGRLKARSVSGSVRLEGQALETIDASTVSGGIQLNSPLSIGPYKFHTVSGNVHWQMPAIAPCTVEMHTVSGSAHSNMLAAHSYTSGRGHIFQVRGGGTLIPFSSVSGSIYLMGPEEQPAEPQPEDAKQAPQAAQRPDVHTVLDMIEKGEMTAEEGLAALQS